MNRDGKRLHFTFFVSGVNFIEDASRNIYQGPGQRRGYSRINFGGSADDVRKRVVYVNELYAQGHEIASHAIGHFNGAHWSAAQWEREFASYRAIVENAGATGARAPADTLDVPPAKIVGFRAPYLAAGTGLYEALRRDGFRYDTSGVAFPDQWPQEFARRVCGLPEVKCAAYSELADYMDSRSPETIAAYQRGHFPHAVPPVVAAAAPAP
jgi:peptidoglycan/xylan/chitin deacetylase (PgdA/CDA1 family)